MGNVIIQEFTTKNPITMIGMEAGVCYGSDISDSNKNYKRGIDCLNNNHGRTWEFPDVYMILDGYSARVFREWYTHIGGAPTRLQASTRYINYQKGFDYFTPPSINANELAKTKYDSLMKNISDTLQELEELGIPREDSANGLPLGMLSKVVCKHNFRNLVDMSHQRECTRAYHEYRKLFRDICIALSEYSEEWKYLVENYFMPKCEVYGYCTEKKPCPRNPKKEN
jgi:thymidylate synthase (FAD)